MSEIPWNFSFSDWFISLSIMFSRPIHAVANGKTFFFLQLGSIPLCKCPIVYPLTTDGLLGFFHILAVVNNPVMNTGMHVSFQISVLVFFRYTLILRSGIAGS